MISEPTCAEIRLIIAEGAEGQDTPTSTLRAKWMRGGKPVRNQRHRDPLSHQGPHQQSRQDPTTIITVAKV